MQTINKGKVWILVAVFVSCPCPHRSIGWLMSSPYGPVSSHVRSEGAIRNDVLYDTVLPLVIISLASLARPSSIVDCMLVLGKLRSFSSGQEAWSTSGPVQMTLLAIGWLPSRQGGKASLVIGSRKKVSKLERRCIALLQTPSAGRTQIAGRMGGATQSK